MINDSNPHNCFLRLLLKLRPHFVRRQFITSLCVYLLLSSLLANLLLPLAVVLLSRLPTHIAHRDQQTSWHASGDSHYALVSSSRTWSSAVFRVKGRESDKYVGSSFVLINTWPDLEIMNAPSWLIESASALSQSAAPDDSLAVVNAVGWPARALVASYWIEYLRGRSQITVLKGVDATFFREGLFGASKPSNNLCILPVVPIWRGFIINTLTFSIPLLLSSTAIRMVRRSHRRRRGHCANCGYAIRQCGPASQTCPECGESS